LPKIVILLSSNSIIHTAGQPFIELISVDSTNNYAMAEIQKGMAEHGMAWFAYNQTAGKGQRGRQWHAMPGQNIMLSVALNTSGLLVSEQFFLLCAIALAAHDIFAKYAGSETSVKWVNDIYWNDRKAGGILIENVLRGNNWQWAVAGMGININQTTFGDNAARAVSLKQITGKTFDVVALAKELQGNVIARFSQLIVDKAGVLDEYNSILYKRNVSVRLKKENIVFNAIIKDALPDGRLRVEGAAWETFGFGEVEWVFG
jgi:BirA family biotin operon repressor/biotin-[acetyl-CoA-carboxylase] ligase